MSYSLIEPKIKPLFSNFTKLFLIPIFLSIFSIIGIDEYLHVKTNLKSTNIPNLTQQIDIKKVPEKKDSQVKKPIQQESTKKVNLAQVEQNPANKQLLVNISKSNQVLRNELKGIFDAIPKDIILLKAVFDRNSLVLKGLMPAFDTYNSSLLPFLKSKYNYNKSSFFIDQDLRYGFDSSSEILEEVEVYEN
ncbi:MAG: hypothetical protein KGV58_01215 [Campylobacteraceae bacterium]|nr:hypothetical protein [Campylobacteraceae bacterium]